MKADPFDQFEAWFTHASKIIQGYPEAMALATATSSGEPSVRMVLLRGWDRHGFRFFTNYNSRKGQELHENPRAALVFYWHAAGRQIRISGRVEQLSSEESDAYFQTRPRGSQIGAWISSQSQYLPPEQNLLQQFERFQNEHSEQVIPRPSYWGGFRLIPESFEFWKNRPHRLHDRTRFVQQSDGSWRIEKLYP